MKASHCDQCIHATIKLYVYRGPPEFDVLTCAKKHKPRFYVPTTIRKAMDGDFGWKRVCGDFQNAP